MPAVLGGRRRRSARAAVRLPRLRHVDPQSLPRAMAAHEPEGGRSLPLRPVHGPLPRCAEHRAPGRTAPGQAHEWPGHKHHLGHPRLGAADPSTLAAISNLGVVLQAKGDLAAAEPLLCEALEVRRENLEAALSLGGCCFVAGGCFVAELGLIGVCILRRAGLTAAGTRECVLVLVWGTCTCMCMHMHMHMHVCMHMHMCMHVCVCMHMHTHMFACMSCAWT